MNNSFLYTFSPVIARGLFETDLRLDGRSKNDTKEIKLFTFDSIIADIAIFSTYGIGDTTIFLAINLQVSSGRNPFIINVSEMDNKNHESYEYECILENLLNNSLESDWDIIENGKGIYYWNLDISIRIISNEGNFIFIAYNSVLAGIYKMKLFKIKDHQDLINDLAFEDLNHEIKLRNIELKSYEYDQKNKVKLNYPSKIEEWIYRSKIILLKDKDTNNLLWIDIFIKDGIEWEEIESFYDEIFN